VGGSEYLAAEHGRAAGRPPAPDRAREGAVREAVRRALDEGLLSSAHDCSVGGLAVSLAQCCTMQDAAMQDSAAGEAPAHVGAAVRIPFPTRKDFVLFSEDAGRVVVSLPNASVARLVELAKECGAPLIQLGVVGGDRLAIAAALDVPVAELARARLVSSPSA
jgi:phosphoribosylformylglycinamidine synthase